MEKRPDAKLTETKRYLKKTYWKLGEDQAKTYRILGREILIVIIKIWLK